MAGLSLLQESEIAPSLKFDTPGRLAMANRGPDTNDSQFFITEAAHPSFNGKYTIWGQCENVDVVKAIAEVSRDSGNKPVTPVHIQHVVIERVGSCPGRCPGIRAACGRSGCWVVPFSDSGTVTKHRRFLR